MDPNVSTPVDKKDQGKRRMDLLPFDALDEIAEVFTFGNDKYGTRGYWELAWSRIFGALMRHASSWFQGEDLDPETGRSHLAHAGCCVLMLAEMESRGLGTDDRPVREQPEMLRAIMDAIEELGEDGAPHFPNPEHRAACAVCAAVPEHFHMGDGPGSQHPGGMANAHDGMPEHHHVGARVAVGRRRYPTEQSFTGERPLGYC